MLLMPSAIILEEGKNLSMKNRACIVSVLGKEDALNFSSTEKELSFFFQ